MSTQEQQEQQEMTETKPRIMTGYVHYGERDDLTKIFDVLNEFRKNNGLKYSHQSRANMIFFNISSTHLDAFSKVRPFKISRFQTKSEYNCDKDVSDKLMGQKDSFLRMMWDESTSTLTFLSRTPVRVHCNLVRRIFTDSGVEFDRDTHNVLKDFSHDHARQDGGEEKREDRECDDEGCDEKDVKSSHDATPEGFQRVESKKNRKPRPGREQREQRELGAPREQREPRPPREPREQREPRPPREQREQRESETPRESKPPSSKVIKEPESKPKIRGAKANKAAPKSNA